MVLRFTKLTESRLPPQSIFSNRHWKNPAEWGGARLTFKGVVLILGKCGNSITVSSPLRAARVYLSDGMEQRTPVPVSEETYSISQWMMSIWAHTDRIKPRSPDPGRDRLKCISGAARRQRLEAPCGSHRGMWTEAAAALQTSVITTHRSDPRGETVPAEMGATHHGWPPGTQKATSLNWPAIKNTGWISRTLSTGKNVEYSHRSARHPRGPVPGPPRPHGLLHSNGNPKQLTQRFFIQAIWHPLVILV